MELKYLILFLSTGMCASVNIDKSPEDLKIQADLQNLTKLAHESTAETKAEDPLWFQGIETWEPPEKLRKGCPWYVMGHDRDERLVFVWEVGRCNFIPFVVKGTPEDAENLVKHITKLLWRIQQTCQNKEEETAMLLLDAKGYNGTQLGYLEVVKKKLTFARQVEHVDSCIANPVMINLTFVSQLFVRLIEGLAGRFVGRMEKFSKQEKWEPFLKNIIPVDQLPPFYGGSAGYKPLES